MPLQIVREDITLMAVDAIVNPADQEPRVGSGVERAIYEAAGYGQLLEQRRKIGRLAPGAVGITEAFGLPAKHIIHVAGIPWMEGTYEELPMLRSCYENALRCAEEQGCRSLAIPFQAAGYLGYPKELALKIATETIRSFLKDAETRKQEELLVYLVVYDSGFVKLTDRLYPELRQLLRDRFENVCCSIADDLQESNEPPTWLRKRKNKIRKLDDFAVEDSVETCAAAESEDSLVEKRQLAKSMHPKVNLKPQRLEDLLKLQALTFSQRLLKLLDERGINYVDFYNRANIDRKLFSKLKNKDYKPSKNTVLAVVVGLKLDEAEAAELMASAGYAWNDSDRTDIIVRFFIRRHEYDIDKLNCALFDYGEKTLGARLA